MKPLGRPLKELTPVNVVVERFSKLLPSPPSVQKDTMHSVNNYSASEVLALEDVPPVPKAVLDGFAASSEEIIDASETSPVKLKISDSCYEGAVPVHTGSPIPEGCDTVIPIEGVEVKGDEILVFRPYPPGNAIAKVGEDLRKGDIILKKGDFIRPWHVAALLSQGITKISVVQPRVAIAATGSELVEPWETGGVRNTTAWLVYTFFKERLGVEPKYFGIIPDDKEKIKQYFEKTMKDFDIVITTGGSSVGKRDYSVEAMLSIEPEEFIHGVALTPGRPMALGFKEGKLLLALSGYPVAALSELEAVVWEILKRGWGLREPPRPKLKAKLTRKLPVQPNMVHLYRMRVFKCDGGYCAEPLRLTGSGVISSLIKGNAIFMAGLRGETGYDEGDEIEVILLSEPVD